MDPLAEDAAGAGGRAGLRRILQGNSLAAFIARTLLWGVLAFLAWHAAERPLSVSCGWVAARLAERLAPVDSVDSRHRGGDLVFVARPDYESRRRANLAEGTELEVATSAATYTYGMPFFVALVLASRARGAAGKLAAGLPILLAVAAAGIAFELLVRIAAVATPGAEPVLALGRGAREGFALGYQLGSLIFPPLAPVLLWIALDWKSVEALARKPR